MTENGVTITKTDRTTQALLAVIAIVLTAILVRLVVPETAAQAHSTPLAGTLPDTKAPVMAVDHNMVYILQNGRLSTYYLDSPLVHSLAPEAEKQKLRHLDTLLLDDQPRQPGVAR